MGREIKDFKIIMQNDGSKNLRFDSNKFIDCCNYAIKEKIKSITLDSEYFKAKDLKPILPLKDFVEELIIYDYIDVSILDSFKNILSLSIIGNKKNIVYLDKFPKLESLNCTYSKNLHGLSECRKLKQLTIESYKSKDHDLLNFPLIPKLIELTIIKSDIITLKGIEKFTYLKELNIWNSSKLETLESLKVLSKNLSIVEIENCKKIKDIEILGKIKSLNKVSITSSGEIPNLAFIKDLHQLEFFTFLNTIVLDGNLTYCENVNYVGFTDKKHYTHKMLFNKQTGLYDMVKK